MRLSHLMSGFVWLAFLLLFSQGLTLWKKSDGSMALASPALCGPHPSLGTTSVLNETMRPANGQYGILSIRNNQPVTLVAVLMDPGMSQRMQVVTIGAGSEAHVQVPEGHYGFGLMLGTEWCNLARGFTDGTMHSINNGVEVKRQLVTQAVVAQGDAPGDISIRFRDLYRTEEVREGGLETHMDDASIIATHGAVNGIPLTLVIDTGASKLTLPIDVARKAGIRCVSQGEYITAAGKSMGCVGVVKELNFGPFRLHDVEAAILPGGEQALLGMNVLRRFTMVWRDDAVRITVIDDDIQLPLHRASERGSLAPVVPWAH